MASQYLERAIDRPEIFCLYKQKRVSIVAYLRIQNKQQQVESATEENS